MDIIQKVEDVISIFKLKKNKNNLYSQLRTNYSAKKSEEAGNILAVKQSNDVSITFDILGIQELQCCHGKSWEVCQAN